MRQTTFIKPAEVTRKWYVVDGAGKNLGRIASEVASVLRGKNKPSYTPNVDCGDYVIIVNADLIEVTGNKMENKKYYSHSQYPGGLRTRTTRVMKEKYTVEWVEKAVHGMLPHTKLGNVQRKHLFVYKGEKHPHTAQQPEVLEIKG